MAQLMAVDALSLWGASNWRGAAWSDGRGGPSVAMVGMGGGDGALIRRAASSRYGRDDFHTMAKQGSPIVPNHCPGKDDKG
jgi:tetrahydromethanopterin S-methyltransferase subunit C